MYSSQLIELAAILSTTLALVPAMAHLLELPNKLHLSREAYLTVQQLYRGWALAGVAVIAALASTAALALKAGAASMVPASVALACILATQAVFWSLTFPVNRRTHNWTVAPADWTRLRKRWEYSHALSALLNLTAVVSVSVAVLRDSC